MSNDMHSEPMDAASVAALAKIGLRFDFVGTDDDAFDAWFQAMGRGFLGPIVEADALEPRRIAFRTRRITGVWDDSGADAATPVATASSWIADLTLPGRRSIPSWAISTITVAPTHRRRGIARQLLESELRTAASLGVPVAILTASDARLYSRYGFAPAAMRADWKIDVAKAKWTGPVPDGRVQLVPSAMVRDGGGFDILERARLATPGLIHFDGLLWERLFGIKGQNDPNQYRVARYDDAAGEPQGFAIYLVKEDEERHTAELIVTQLVAVTADAASALWKYLLEIDLITTVIAELRPIEEPVYWQIEDPRAARKHDEGDHLWARILDVTAALEARTYSAPGVFVLRVMDTLGFADGSFLLEIGSSGVGTVTPLDSTAAYEDNHSLELSIVELAAIYLGATPVSTLVAAGRIRELRDGSAAAVDAAFRSPVTPWLSIWF